MNTAIKTAVIGAGHLGQFHIQKYAALANCELVAVVDSDLARAQSLAAQYHTTALTDYRQLFGKVDAVSIVVPTSLHHAIARDFLANGIHVLVEKPITVTTEEADELIALCAQNQLVLQVGHLERFNPALLALDGVLKKPLFIEAHRLAPYKPRALDVNVVLDLMIHDIDIILNLVKSPIKNIAASGTAVLSPSTDICNARIDFDCGAVANVTASRISLKSERKMRIFQERGCATVDFQNRALTFYHTDGSFDANGVPSILTDSQTWQDGDALLAEVRAFVHAVATKSAPVVSGEDGKRALNVASLISKMVK